MCLCGGGGGRRHLPADGASIRSGSDAVRDPTGARNWALAGNNKTQVQSENARPSSILVFLPCKPIYIFSFPFTLCTAHYYRSNERGGALSSYLVRELPAAGKRQQCRGSRRLEHALLVTLGQLVFHGSGIIFKKKLGCVAKRFRMVYFPAIKRIVDIRETQAIHVPREAAWLRHCGIDSRRWKPRSHKET